LGSGGVSPRILTLGTRWRSVVSFTPRPLYSRCKSPRYSLDKRLVGPQGRSVSGGVDRPAHSLVPILTGLLIRLNSHTDLDDDDDDDVYTRAWETIRT